MEEAWREYYESHTMSAEEAVAKIHDGDTVVDVIGTAEPQHLFRVLTAAKDRFGEKGVEILTGLNQGPAPYAEPACYPNLRVRAIFAGRNNRAAL